MQNHLDYLQTALEMVMAWELPEEEIPRTVLDLSMMMADYPPEDIWDGHIYS